MNVLGIDPGLSGGYGVLFGAAGPAIVAPMPIAGKRIDYAELAKEWRSMDIGAAMIEDVHAMPKQGVVSCFTFGRGLGGVEGVLAALGIATHYVTPQAWKKRVLAGTAKDKEAAIDFCRSAYPSVPLILPRCRTPHDGMADALCIATYGVWTLGGVRA